MRFFTQIMLRNIQKAFNYWLKGVGLLNIIKFGIDKLINWTRIFYLLPDKYFLIDTIGGKMYLNLRESKMMLRCALGIYELGKKRLFESILNSEMTIIDLGANIGYFSMYSAKLIGQGGVVFSIEPHPENCSWLKKSIKANGYKNIQVVPIAISNRNGETKLYSSNISGHHSIIRGQGFGTIKVQVETLESFVANQALVNIDLIKIDVEGAEVRVLEGAQNILRNENKLIILMDIHAGVNRRRIFNLLTENDFELFKFHPLGIDMEKLKTEGAFDESIKEIMAIKKDHPRLKELTSNYQSHRKKLRK